MQLGLLVLHLAAILAHIFVLLLVCVFLDEGRIVLDIALALLSGAHSMFLACSSIQTCLKHLELVTLGSVRVAYLPLDGCTLAIAVPELGIVLDDGTDVADSPIVIPDVVQQEGSVVESDGIVGLQIKYEIEILDGEVVFAHAGTKQASVVVGDVVAGLQVETGIIVGHRSAQIVLIVARQSTVDVEARHSRHLRDGFVERCLSFLVFLAACLEHSLEAPSPSVIFVQFKGFVRPFLSLNGICA